MVSDVSASNPLAPERDPDRPPSSIDLVDPAVRERLFVGRHLPLALGSAALVTLGAFVDRAVGTALPTMVRELHAVRSFGVLTAAPLVSYVVALAIAGRLTDRRGPVPALRLGIVGFALAQLLVGLAWTMPIVLLGRLLSGAGEAMLDVALTVLVARVLPERLRARMFAMFAAMWALPSVVGPVVTGVVTEQLGWRWVFLGALALLPPTWLLLRPALRLATGGSVITDPAAGTEAPRRFLPWAFTAAAAVLALSLAGSALSEHTTPALAVIAAAAGLVVAAARRLLPVGTLTARRGFPTVVVLRALSSCAFGGAGAFLPLLLTVVRGQPPTRAGVTLTVTGLMWAGGSWLQGRQHTHRPVRMLRLGLAAMSAGLLATTLLAPPGVPIWVGLCGWAVAGIGIGMTSPTLSLLALELSEPHEQGRNTSAMRLAGSLSTAVWFAAGGAMVSVFGPASSPGVFATLILAAAALALLGLLLTRRIPPSRLAEGEPTQQGA
jgi:MFS family permease